MANKIINARDITVDLADRRDEARVRVELLQTQLEQIQIDLSDARREAKAAETLYEAEQRRWANQQPQLLESPGSGGVFVDMSLRVAVLQALKAKGSMSLTQIEDVLVKGGFRFSNGHPGRSIHGALFGAKGAAQRNADGMWSYTIIS